METVIFVTGMYGRLNPADLGLEKILYTTVIGMEWTFIMFMMVSRMRIITVQTVETNIFLVVVMRYYGKCKYNHTCER